MFPLFVTAFIALVAAVSALIQSYRDQLATHKRIEGLQTSILEAQRLLKQKGDLANEVAHEIKNPLTAILCSVETLELLVGPELAEDHRRSLLYIKDYSDSLLRLVTAFIDINRAEVGKLSCRRENFEIIPIAESVVGLLSSTAMKKHIALELTFTDREIAAFADPIFVKQILFNLIHNALKFTGENGEVEVTVSQSDSTFIALTVKDNGVGIPPERLDALFDPYSTRATSNNRNENGVGLGLALTKTLTSLLNGTVDVYSTVNQGTTFTVKIPASQENMRRSIKLRADEIKPLKGFKFLVVDQDLGTRDSVSSLIEAWGGMVDKISLAAEALDAIAKKDYQAVLLDETLSGVDGFELTKIIKTNHTNDKARIILTSFKDEAEKSAATAGADQCLKKPFDGRKLLDALKDQTDA